jgi:hypothetical protein
MTNTLVDSDPHHADAQQGIGIPIRQPAIETLNRPHVNTEDSPATTFAVAGILALMVGFMACAYWVGQKDGIATGKEIICTETGWQSPTCKTDLYRRMYLKDPQ